MDLIRIILGEDHALMREGTRQILQQQSDLRVVGEAGDGNQVIALAQELQPDVAILDIHMPGPNAIEITRRLASVASKTQVLILTAYDDDELILAAMEAGAAGYLLKTVRASELVDAVRAVHQGRTVLDSAVARKIAMLASRHRLEPVPEETLTPRELDVLQLVSLGLRNKEIASQLGVSNRTVEGHLSNILAKLGVSTRTAAVVRAVANNWLQLANGEDHV